jgi:hypothetical protein
MGFKEIISDGVNQIQLVQEEIIAGTHEGFLSK